MKRKDFFKSLAGLLLLPFLPKKKPEGSPIGYFYFWNKNTVTITSGQQEARNVVVIVPDKSKLVIPVIRPGETHTYEFDPKKGWIKDSVKFPYMGKIYNA